LKDSRGMHRRQTTQYRGYLQEVGVELRDNEEVQSISPASERGKDGGKEDTSRLLERILDRDNLNQAYLRVKRNKGSHGVDVNFCLF